LFKSLLYESDTQLIDWRHAW